MRIGRIWLIALALGTTSVLSGCKFRKGAGSSDGGATTKEGEYQVTCEWVPTKNLNAAEAKAWNRYDLNITVKGEPANLLVFVYGADGKMVYDGHNDPYGSKITVDEMRLSRVGLWAVVDTIQEEGTYTVMVRKQGSDELAATAKVIRKGKGG